MGIASCPRCPLYLSFRKDAAAIANAAMHAARFSGVHQTACPAARACLPAASGRKLNLTTLTFTLLRSLRSISGTAGRQALAFCQQMAYRLLDGLIRLFKPF